MSTTSNTVMTREGSDSNSINNPYRPKKSLRHHTLPSPARFKGVVLQQNGHWGAQIYANHQRIWLGTFKSEKEAAMAYDSAAIKLRSGGDSYRNFPWTNLTIQEPTFQNLFSTKAVLNMIKEGSYESKFADYLRTQSSKATFDGLLELKRGFVNQDGVECQQLFQKELTPSDVGKLNRLVIPKKHAVKFFPPLIEGRGIGEENSDGGSEEEVQLEFFENSMRSWKFRYCYWKSSQSFVFTRGWNRFVKDKQLKAKDVVAFYECRYKEVSTAKKAFWMIDVVSDGGGETVEGGIDKEVWLVGGELQLQLGLGGWSGDGAEECKSKKDDEEKEEELANMHPRKKCFRLFGKEINK